MLGGVREQARLRAARGGPGSGHVQRRCSAVLEGAGGVQI